MNTNTSLDKCKIPELKEIAKKYKLKVSGTKPLLLQRIREHMGRETSATHIQRLFRGYMARFLFRHLGATYKNRDFCVNECDGCTLEPLNDIPFPRFYSCKDEKDFLYGFDIISLLTMFHKCNTINPYTRETMSRNTVNTVKTLGRLILILLPETIERGERDVIDMKPPVLRSRREPIAADRQENTRMPRIYDTTVNTVVNRNRNRNVIFNALTRQTNIHMDLYVFMCQPDFTDVEYTVLNKIIDVRRLPIHQRISDVFIEIDLLGNYTQSVWFSTLSIHQYCHFFRHLQEIWNYRGNIPPEIKQQICILYDPFMNLRLPHPNVQELCTTVIENMVYGSLDPEYRKLACMHILTALTLVSREARQQLYWLYESII